MTTSHRLNKELALRLGISRREADDLLNRKRIQVNGSVAIIGQRVGETDDITLDGEAIKPIGQLEYILLNKPVGYVCSRRKQGENETIYALLPDKLHHLKPVGRLDKDSSGLILLTNDGDFAHQMTHPKFAKEKIYEIEIDKPLALGDKQSIEQGIEVENYTSRLKLTPIKDQENRSWRVVMSQGRNRQIRRTFAALGYTVTTLHRTQFGSFSLTNYPLQPGQWQELPSHLLQ